MSRKPCKSWLQIGSSHWNLLSRRRRHKWGTGHSAVLSNGRLRIASQRGPNDTTQQLFLGTRFGQQIELANGIVVGQHVRRIPRHQQHRQPRSSRRAVRATSTPLILPGNTTSDTRMSKTRSDCSAPGRLYRCALGPLHARRRSTNIAAHPERQARPPPSARVYAQPKR